MTQRKTFSLTKSDMLKLDPLLEKHNGNFSAAIRELIALGDEMSSRFGSLENALREMHPKKSLQQELVENRYGIILPYALMQWGLRLLEGFLPPKGSLVTPVHDSMAQSRNVSLAITSDNCDKWEALLNELYPQMGWEVKITMESADDTLVVNFSGLDPEINRLAQMVLSVRLAFQDPPYKIEELKEYLPLVSIYFRQCDSQEEAAEQLEHAFNYEKKLCELLQERRSLLSKLASLVHEFNYDTIILPSEYMEELLSGHLSLLLLRLIQRHMGRSVSELSKKELLDALEKINDIIHLYEKMEREDYRIVFFHSYDNPDSVKKLSGVLSEILGQANLSSKPEIAENMLIFKLRPVTIGKPRLLIGEEKLDSLLSLKYELEHDYDIIDAQDGIDALEKAQKKPDVILLTTTLPRMTGTEICSRLKREESTTGIPVILIVPEDSSPEELSTQGADDYIARPFEIADLKRRIESALQKKSNPIR
jgi:CheY-like chemotaxis protein